MTASVALPDLDERTISELQMSCTFSSQVHPRCDEPAKVVIHIEWTCGGTDLTGVFLFCQPHTDWWLPRPEISCLACGGEHPCTVTSTGRI